MLTYKQIIEKLKDIISKELGNKKVFDKDVAHFLSIDYNTFRQHKYHNRQIPYIEIMSFLAKRNISINWFFFGQLPESLIDATSKYIMLRYHQNIIAGCGGSGSAEDGYVSIVVDSHIIEYLHGTKYTEVINVHGDSMEPIILNNALIFVDISVGYARPGVYVIRDNGELFVKYLIAQLDTYIIRSINQSYKDIYSKEVVVVGKVIGVLNKV